MECRKELSGVKRREQIIDNLREHGEVTVKILSNQFGVFRNDNPKRFAFIRRTGLCDNSLWRSGTFR